jgi:hypothetical protein
MWRNCPANPVMKPMNASAPSGPAECALGEHLDPSAAALGSPVVRWATTRRQLSSWGCGTDGCRNLAHPGYGI